MDNSTKVNSRRFRDVSVKEESWDYLGRGFKGHLVPTSLPHTRTPKSKDIGLLIQTRTVMRKIPRPSISL